MRALSGMLRGGIAVEIRAVVKMDFQSIQKKKTACERLVID